MIHQTINWPNQRVPVFLCETQYTLPSSAKLSNRSSFLAAFFFPEVCCLVMHARRNEFESERGQKLAALVAYSTVIWTQGPFFVKEGVSSPRAMVMFHPLSTAVFLSPQLRKYFAFATNSCNNSTAQQTLFWIKQLIRWQITTVGNS